jgi:hypothetical protein
MNDAPHEQYRPQEVPRAPQQLAWQPSATEYQAFSTNAALSADANQALIKAGIFNQVTIDFSAAPLLAQAFSQREHGHVEENIYPADGSFRTLQRTAPSVQAALESGEGLTNSLNQPVDQYKKSPFMVRDAILELGPVLDTAVNYYFNNSAAQVKTDAQDAGGTISKNAADWLSVYSSEDAYHRGHKIGDVMAVFMPVPAWLKRESLLRTEMNELQKLEDQIGKRSEMLRSVDSSPEAIERASEAVRSKVTHEKVANYLFNPESKDGWPKGKWFTAALGFDPANSEHIALLEKQIKFDPDRAICRGQFQYGVKYDLDLAVTGPNGRTIEGIHTVWQTDKDSGITRLVTIIPAKN